MYQQSQSSTAFLLTPIDRMQMTDEDVLIVQGLERGMAAMLRTTGLRVDPALKYDVLAVALVRLFEQMPACAEPYRVLDALTKRAISLAPSPEDSHAA